MPSTDSPAYTYREKGILPWYPVLQEEYEALKKCVYQAKGESEAIWKPITKRAKTKPPERFAVAIMQAHKSMRQLYPIATSHQIDEYQSVALKVRNWADNLKEMMPGFGDDVWWQSLRTMYPEGHPLHHKVRSAFRKAPVNALELLADYLESEAARAEKDSIRAWIGQPGRQDAKWNYFIRKLSHYMQQLYGQPLDAPVAAVATVLSGWKKPYFKNDVERLRKKGSGTKPAPDSQYREV
jgi:hypothetical protein